MRPPALTDASKRSGTLILRVVYVSPLHSFENYPTIGTHTHYHPLPIAFADGLAAKYGRERDQHKQHADCGQVSKPAGFPSP
jgi:hypothetical protein